MHAEQEKLWARYCVLRDGLMKVHENAKRAGRRTPKNIFLFCVSPRERYRRFNPPDFLYPKRTTDWLRAAISRCEKAVLHPDSL